MSDFYFFNSKIDGRISGVEYSSFKRAVLFQRNYENKVIFVTLNLSVNNYIFWNKYVSLDLIPKNSTHLNVYDDYMRLEDNVLINSTSIDYKKVNKIFFLNGFTERLEFNSDLTWIVRWRDEGKSKIYLISYIYKGVLVKRDFFNKFGVVSISRFYKNDGVFYMDHVFDIYGNRRLIIDYDEKGNKNKISVIDNNTNAISNVFSSESDFVYSWLWQIGIKEKDFCFVDKNRSWSIPLSRFRSKFNVVSISIIHSSHLRDSYKHPNDSNLNSNYRNILKGELFFDHLIVLTEEQKNDMKKTFDGLPAISVIPHSKKESIKKVNFGNRNKDKIVMMGRLSKEKQFDHAIEVMRKVVEVYPMKKLYIYGEGKLRKYLEKIILKYNLEGSVFLPGHIDNVSEVLDTSILYLCTSAVEGFPLAILDSLSHGVPVVSYDIKYGPTSMINDKNGILVERNNVDEMAAKLLDLLGDDEAIFNMSENAYDMSNKFSSENILIKWRELLGGRV